MYYTAVASPRVCCATIQIHVLTAASLRSRSVTLLLCLYFFIIVIIIISMCNSVRHCSTVQQGEWQLVAVRTAVCSSALAVVYV